MPTQQPVGTEIWIAIAWCVGIRIVTYVVAMGIDRRKISQWCRRYTTGRP